MATKKIDKKITKKNTSRKSVPATKIKKTTEQKSSPSRQRKTAAAPIRSKRVVPPKDSQTAVRPAPAITPARSRKIQAIRLHLLQQKESLLSEAEVALNELPGQAMFPDMGDQASAETDMNFMLRLRGREQRLLKKIDEAIDRIDSGLFGVCESCGEEIGIKRLEARPVTTMCIDCKTLQEEEEKRREV